MSELASYELDGRIATITIDDGKVNAFSVAMLQAIHAAFDRAEQDEAVVVLGGRPGYFSAGFDLRVFAAGGEQVLEMLTLGATLAERILSFPTPVVLACDGHTVAAGAFMTLAADARIGAAGDFQIGLNEVRIGLTMPSFVVELARARLNPADFNRAVVSATMYDPEAAVRAGFFDRVVPAAELERAARETAEALAELNPAAHAATKLRARGDVAAAVRAAIEREMNPEVLLAATGPS